MSLQRTHSRENQTQHVKTSWTRVKTNILNAEKEALKKIQVNTNRKTSTKQVKEVTQEKKIVHFCDTYIFIRNKTNKKIWLIKESYWGAFIKEIKNDLYGWFVCYETERQK